MNSKFFIITDQCVRLLQHDEFNYYLFDLENNTLKLNIKSHTDISDYINNEFSIKLIQYYDNMVYEFTFTNCAVSEHLYIACSGQFLICIFSEVNSCIV